MPTGKLYRRGEKWYLDIHTGRKVGGKYERIQRKAQGRTKAEAQAELDEMLYTLRRASTNGKANNNKYLLEVLCKEWCEHIQRNIADPGLAAEYCRHAQRLTKALPCETVADLNLESVEKALCRIAEEKSTNTANKALAKFKAALEYGVDRGVIISNPIAKAKQLKTVRKKFRRALTVDEVKMLLKVAPEPWRTVWHFVLSTGVRRDEMIYLRKSDLDLKRGTVRIQERMEFKPKTQAGSRTIPLNDAIKKALAKLNKGEGELLFTNGGRPLNSWALMVFRRHMEAALIRLARIYKRFGKPLPEGVRVEDGEFKVDVSQLDLHAMRYTFITELIAANVDPKTTQHLAGHKDIKTTLAIYAQVKGSNVEDAVQLLPW
ncbi:MAG: site-specific integrase [Planctomycetaceae bacterium]|nr:site-specific integrase [Planctomycetaceae bacterium]